MWNDSEKIAAMEALKDEPAPVKDKAAEALLASLEKSAGGDLAKITQARVMRLLTPVVLEMKTAFEARDAEKVSQISRGMLRGLGFGISTTLPFVPPPYMATALTMLFEYATQSGVIDVTAVPKEPKK